MDRQQLRSELRKEGLLGRDRGTLHVSNGSLQLKLDGRYYALGVREDDGFLAITETLRSFHRARTEGPMSAPRTLEGPADHCQSQSVPLGTLWR